MSARCEKMHRADMGAMAGPAAQPASVSNQVFQSSAARA